MAEVRVVDEIQAPSESVWKLVRDFGGIMKWSGGAIESCSVEGEGVGAVRTISIAGGASLQEKLEAQDEAGRSFSYSFVGEVIIPVTDYYATLTIRDGSAGPEICEVEWGSSFEPNGISETQAVSMIEGIYKNGIGGIKQALER